MTGKSRNRRRRRAPIAATALGFALVVLLVLPLTSLGAGSQPTLGAALGTLLKNATSSVESTVAKLTTPQARSGTAARPSAAPASAPASTPAAHPAASGSSYTPPMYGTNPHGQGTVGDVALNPSSNVPYTYSTGGNSNAIVVGRGRSEQQADGTYDAHTTIIGLFGNDLIPEDASQGQSLHGPLNAIQTGILDNLCTSTSMSVCLTVLAADTSANSSGASTHFQTAGVSSKALAGLTVGAATSNSSIQTTGNCQTSEGDSNVANVALATGPVAGVSSSKETSTACSGQTPTQSASSSVINLGATGVGLPAAGCANGTPNTAFSALVPLANIVCNADDVTQAAAPAGVREALTVIGLQLSGSTELLRATTAASESHAVAPASTTPPSTCTDTDKDCGGGETCVNGKDPDGDGDCTGGTGNKCTDTDHDCGVGSNGQPETCVNGKDPDGDGDCTSGSTPGGKKSCTEADHDCGIGPNGQPEVCVNGADPDGDGDCTTVTPSSGQQACTDSDTDCGKLPSGASEACVNSADPDVDADCVSQVTAVAAKTTLPFTGENILEVLLVGLLLTGGGLTLANRTRAASKRRR